LRVFSGPEITEGETAYALTIASPGVSAENIEITVVNGYMTVTARGNQDGKSAAAERVLSCVAIPNDVDTAQISAEVKAGVLTIRLPRASTTIAIGPQASAT
jgi:HSP20 family molecular chaperone IbpA